MTFKFPPLFLCLLSSIHLHADLADTSFVIKDGGKKRTFVVSKTELQLTDGKSGKSSSYKTDKYTKNSTLLKGAEDLAKDSGDEVKLVLYPNGATPSLKNRRVLTKDILVEIDNTTTAKALAKKAGAKSFKSPSYAPQYVILSFDEIAAALTELADIRSLSGVVSAEAQLGKPLLNRSVLNDPLYTYNPFNEGYQWHLKNTGENDGVEGIDVNIESVWETYTGSGVNVGVVDNGLQTDHPDLAANVNTDIDHNWADGDADDPTPDADSDHGTACAGVVGAVANNGIGGRGAAPEATLVGLRLGSFSEAATDEDEAGTANWRNDIIPIKSNSWGPEDGTGMPTAPSALFLAALDDSIVNGRAGLGTIHLWAAGNGGNNDDVNLDGYASSIYTIGVGAIADDGSRSNYSEPGASKLISSTSAGRYYNQYITTTSVDSGYTYSFGGTSSATPLVAGIVALMLEANPDLSWRDVQEILVKSARKVNPTDDSWADNGAGIPFSHDYGAGLVDAASAVSLAETWVSLGSQKSYSVSSDVLPSAIPDDSAVGTSASFTVSSADSFQIEQVTLTATITHANRADLEVLLTSPSGTTSILASNVEVDEDDDSADYSDWTFMTVHNWGELSEGEWTLEVIDSTGGDAGTLDSATLEIFGTDAVPVSSLPEFVSSDSVKGTETEVLYHRLIASSGVTSYTVTNLPDGLSFDSTTAVISGTPTTEGIYNVAVSATNSLGTTNAIVQIIISEEPVVIPLLAESYESNAQQGLDYTFTIDSYNDPSSFTASPLPAGLSLDATSGIISGVPTSLGTTEVNISAINDAGSATSVLTIYVVEPIWGEYSEALDNDTYVFLTDGSVDYWTNQAAVSYVDNDALQSPTVDHDEATSFNTTVNETGVLSFWAKVSTEEEYDFLTVSVNGIQALNLSGQLDWQEYSIDLTDDENVVTWEYNRDDTAGEGSNQVWLDGVSFVSKEFINISIEDAVDFAGIDWPESSDWQGQADTTFDGVDAIESNGLGHSSEATISFDVEGPGTFSFYYKVSSEEDYDYFLFGVDDDVTFYISGDIEWAQYTEVIPAGTHTLSFVYYKDDAVSSLEDKVWVDQVSWVPDSIANYASWQTIYFSAEELADTTISAYGADADGDGLVNLFEYASGSSPVDGDSTNEFVYSKDDTALYLDFPVDTSKTDVRVFATTSVDLIDFAEMDMDVLQTVGDIETRRASLPITKEKEFMRIEVELIE